MTRLLAHLKEEAMSATQPFQTTVEIKLPSGTEGQNGSFHVPKGKRLVLDFASGEAFLPAGQKAVFSVITSLAGQPTGISHYLASTTLGTFGAAEYFGAGQIVRLYADPGTVVMLRVDRDAPTGDGLARMSVSGELVAVP